MNQSNKKREELQNRITEIEETIRTRLMDFYTNIEIRNELQDKYMQIGDRKNQIRVCKDLINKFKKNIKQYKELTIEEEKIIDKKAKGNRTYILSTYYRKANLVLAVDYFEYFVICVEWNFRYEKSFYYSRECAMKEWVEELQKLEDGEYEGLAISAPPRTGKTGIGFLFLLWCILRHPEKSCFFVSHSNRVVKMLYDKMLKWFSDERRLLFEIFPNIEIADNSAEDKWIDLKYKDSVKQNDYKTLYLASIDTGLAGYIEASHLIYCDDLIANSQEAKNPDRLDNAYEKYSNDIIQRASCENVLELHIATRWGKKDVITRIEDEENQEDSLLERKKWKFIKRPAIDEETGESNFNFRYNPMTKNYFMKKKKRLEDNNDEYAWYSIYQQSPQDREGILFPERLLKRYKTLPDQEPDAIYAACDVAFSGTDYLSMPTAYQYGEDVYIVDVVFDNRDYMFTQPLVVNSIIKHEPNKVKFEANNGGEFYCRDIIRIVRNRVDSRIVSERTLSNISKLARIEQHEPAIKSFYYLDKSMYAPGSSYYKFMTGLTSFNINGSNRNDDAPDSLAMLAVMKRNTNTNNLKIFPGKMLAI